MEYFAEYNNKKYGLGKIFYFLADDSKKYVDNFDPKKWRRTKMSPELEVQLSAQSCVQVERI